MFICKECGENFVYPKEYINRHVPDNYLYNEHYSGCPYCGGAYTEAYTCDNCGEWITGDYIVLNGKRFCDECYELHNIEDD